MFVLQVKGAKELATKLDKAEKGMRDFLTRNMDRACITIENQARLNVTGGVRLPMEGGGPWSQPYLHVRGNRLRPSYAHKTELHGREVVGRVGSALIYARVHEFGATIHAKSKPYLTFPIKVMGTLSKSGKMRSRQMWVRVKQVRIPARHPLRYAGELKKAEVVRYIGEQYGLYIKGHGL